MNSSMSMAVIAQVFRGVALATLAASCARGQPSDELAPLEPVANTGGSPKQDSGVDMPASGAGGKGSNSTTDAAPETGGGTADAAPAGDVDVPVLADADVDADADAQVPVPLEDGRAPSNDASAEPPILVIADGTPSGVHMPSTGGSEFDQRCDEGQVIIGYQGTRAPEGMPGGGYIRTFEALCGTPSISPAPPYEITIVPTDSLPSIGSMPGSEELGPAECPENQVVVAFAGRSGQWIDALEFYCAPLTVLGDVPDLIVAVGDDNAIEPSLGGNGGNPFAQLNCPSDQVAIGHQGRSGGAIDAFGLICGTPAVTNP